MVDPNRLPLRRSTPDHGQVHEIAEDVTGGRRGTSIAFIFGKHDDDQTPSPLIFPTRRASWVNLPRDFLWAIKPRTGAY
jgi:hypothetical protein